jgi:hypothetical protein
MAYKYYAAVDSLINRTRANPIAVWRNDDISEGYAVYVDGEGWVYCTEYHRRVYEGEVELEPISRKDAAAVVLSRAKVVMTPKAVEAALDAPGELIEKAIRDPRL